MKLEGKPLSKNATQSMKTEKKQARELWHRDKTQAGIATGYAGHSLLLLSRKQSVTNL